MITDLGNYWTEKYRPKKLDDMILSDSDKKIMQKFIDNQDIPNMLFIGKSGTGKSTLARILMSTVTNTVEDRMFINASDNRGIDVVRNKIIPFMGIPPYKSSIKIIMLDEADNMTDDAFMALRSAIEDPTVNQGLKTRFILTANDSGGIPDAIKSRMNSITYNKPSKEEIVERCEQILNFENIKFNPDVVAKIVENLYPDMRSIIGSLGMSVIDGVVVEKFIPIQFDIIKDHIRGVFKATTFDDAVKSRGDLIDSFSEEYEILEVINWILDEYIEDPLIHTLAYRYLLLRKYAIDGRHHIVALVDEVVLSKFTLSD